MVAKKITDKTIVKVFNNSTGSVGYTVDNVTRKFDKPNASRDVEFKELQNLFNVAGGRELFSEDILLIKDNTIREELSLHPMDKYILDEEGIVNLFDSSDDELEDVLQNCTDLILEKITQVAIKLPLNELSKVNLIKNYSGLDIYSVIEESKVEKVDKKVTTNSKPKRTPKKS